MSNFQILGRRCHPEPIIPIPNADFIVATTVGLRGVVIKKSEIVPSEVEDTTNTAQHAQPGPYIFFPEDAILPALPLLENYTPGAHSLIQEVSHLTDFLRNSKSVKPALDVRRFKGAFSMGLYLRVDPKLYPKLFAYLEAAHAIALDPSQSPSWAIDIIKSLQVGEGTTHEYRRLDDEVSTVLDPAILGMTRKADPEESDGANGGGGVESPHTLGKDECPSIQIGAFDVDNARNGGLLANMIKFVLSPEGQAIGAQLEVTEKLEGQNTRLCAKQIDPATHDPDNGRHGLWTTVVNGTRMTVCYEIVCGSRNRWHKPLSSVPGQPPKWMDAALKYIGDSHFADITYDMESSNNFLIDQTRDRKIGLWALHELFQSRLSLLVTMPATADTTLTALFPNGVEWDESYRNRGLLVLFGELYGNFTRGGVSFTYDASGAEPGFRAFDMWDGINHRWLNPGCLLGYVPTVPILGTFGASEFDPEAIDQEVATLSRLAEGPTAVDAKGQAIHPREGAVYRVVSREAHMPGVNRYGGRGIGKTPGEGYLLLKYAKKNKDKS